MRDKILAALLAIALASSVTFVGLVGPAAATTGYTVEITGDEFVEDGDDFAIVDVIVNGTAVSDGTIDETDVVLEDDSGQVIPQEFVDDDEPDEILVGYDIPVEDVQAAGTLTVYAIVDGTTEASFTITYDGGDGDTTNGELTVDFDAPAVLDVTETTVPITITATGGDIMDGTIVESDVELEDVSGQTYTASSSTTDGDTITVDYDLPIGEVGTEFGDSEMFYAVISGVTEATTTVELTDLDEWGVHISPETQTVEADEHPDTVFVDVWASDDQEDLVDLDAIEISPDTLGDPLTDADNTDKWWNPSPGDFGTYTVLYHGYELGSFEILEDTSGGDDGTDDNDDGTDDSDDSDDGTDDSDDSDDSDDDDEAMPIGGGEDSQTTLIVVGLVAVLGGLFLLARP